jgi:hypothetical protein
LSPHPQQDNRQAVFLRQELSLLPIFLGTKHGKDPITLYGFVPTPQQDNRQAVFLRQELSLLPIFLGTKHGMYPIPSVLFPHPQQDNKNISNLISYNSNLYVKCKKLAILKINKIIRFEI